MTADQVKYLKEQLNKDNGNGKPVANSVFYDLDNGMTFRNVGDFVLFDDANELLHCISANRNNNLKHECPYSMITASYEMLQFTEANLTLDGLKNLLDGMLAGIVTDEQKQQINDWALELPVNPIGAVVSTYHKEPNPKVPYKPLTVVTRPDGVHNGYPVTTNKSEVAPVKTTTSAKAAEAVKELTDGTTIAISGSDPITSMEVTANDVTITGKDLPMEAATISGNNVTLKGMTFTNTAESTKSANILKLTGNNATVENSVIKDNGNETSVGVNVTGEEVTFTGCTFDGTYNIYNGLNIASGSANGTSKPVTSVVFRDCVFTKDFSNNNHINIYGLADNAQILIDNCSFEAGVSTNPIRFGNETNGKNVIVTITNCKYGKTEPHGEYDGLILFQDHTKSSVKEETGACQDFSTWTVNIINLTNLYTGAKIVEKGAGINRIWYCYGVNEGMEPTVNFS